MGSASSEGGGQSHDASAVSTPPKEAVPAREGLPRGLVPEPSFACLSPAPFPEPGPLGRGDVRGEARAIRSPTPWGRGEPGESLGRGPDPPPLSPQWAEQGCEHFVCSSGQWRRASSCVSQGRALYLSGPWFPQRQAITNARGSPRSEFRGGGGKSLVGGGVRSPEAGDDSPSWAPKAILH